MAISTTLSVQDRMSAVIKYMTESTDRLVESMSRADEASEAMFANADLSGAAADMESVADAADKAADSMGDASGESAELPGNIEDASDAATKLQETLTGVLGTLTAMGTAKALVSLAEDSLDLNYTQQRQETMLRVVLKNLNAEADAYDRIVSKAAELQKRSIYGDEAYIAGAGELLKYVGDVDAVLVMMDTLANWATGYSNGAEMSPDEMISAAQQLGRVVEGSYMMMERKGFEFSDVQKDIIENGTDMEKALTISDVVSGSWDGLAAQMADLSGSKMVQLKNAIGDVKEEIGNELAPVIQEKLIDNLAGIVAPAAAIFTWLSNGIAGVWNFAVSAVEDVALFFAGFIDFCSTAPDSLWRAIIYGVADTVDTAIRLLTPLAELIDALTGSSFVSSINEASDSLYQGAYNMVGNRDGSRYSGKYSVITSYALGTKEDDKDTRSAVRDAFEDWKLETTDVQEAFDNAFDWGLQFKTPDALSDILSGSNVVGSPIEQIADATTETAANTGRTREITDEEVKYLRDIAERDAINRFTTAEIKVELGGVTNNVGSDTDLDGFITRLTDRLSEELAVTSARYNMA